MKRLYLLLLFLVTAFGCAEPTQDFGVGFLDPGLGIYESERVGMAMYGGVKHFSTVSGTFADPINLTGSNGDGFSPQVNMGRYDGSGAPTSGVCKMRGGLLDVIGPGGTRSFFTLYGASDSNGTLHGSTTPGHAYKVTMYTTDNGQHLTWQFKDTTTGYVLFYVTKNKPSNCAFSDLSLDWTFERPVWGGTRRPLANYHQDGSFFDVQAIDTLGQAHVFSDQRDTVFNTIAMTGANGDRAWPNWYGDGIFSTIWLSAN